MVNNEIQDHINLIKKKLSMLREINEDTINEIIQDINCLLKFQSDGVALLIFKRNKKTAISIKQNKSPNIKAIQNKPIINSCITITPGGSCFENGNDF